jgi:hypothetical protein
MAKKGGGALGNKNYQLVTVDDLTGGVDLRRSPSLLQTTRARVLRNVSLQEPGAWQPYPGWKTWSTTNLGVEIVGGRRIYLAGATFTLVGTANGFIVKPTDAGVWGGGMVGGRSTINQHYFVYDRNLVALFDGLAPMVKSTDGTTWTAFGLTPHTFGPGLVGIAGGTLVATNTYEVAYTYSDDALSAESIGSPTSTITLAAGQGTIRVTMARSADPQVDKLYIYARNVTAGESVLRRAGSVANPAGATTTFDITAPTMFFPDGLEIPTRHELPKAMSYGVVWRNRWWGLDATVGNRIRFTEVFLPQAWPALFYVDIPFEKGDRITGLVALGDTLIVLGNTGIFLIIGQTSLDFEVRPSAGAVAGSLGLRAVWVIEQGVVHCSEGGVYIFDGATDRLLSDSIVAAWRNMMETSTPERLSKIAVTYHERRKEVRISIPRLYETAGPGEWILDLSRTRAQEDEAWTSTDRAIGGYIPWDGKEAVAGDQGRLLSWKLQQGQLAEEAVGSSADGADMVCIYEGPALLAAPRRWTRYIDLFGEFGPAPGSFGVEVRVDDAPVTNLSFNIGASVGLYGPTSLYGTAVYGGRQRRNFTSMLPVTAEGLTLTLRATYTGQALFRWFTYAVGHRPEPQLRGFM